MKPAVLERADRTSTQEKRILSIKDVTEEHPTKPNVHILRKSSEFTDPVSYDGMLLVLNGTREKVLELLHGAAEEAHEKGEFSKRTAEDNCWKGEYALGMCGIKTSNGRDVRLRALHGDIHIHLS